MIEFVSTTHTKPMIESTLFLFGPDVKVVGSRMTEDGFDLVLEGPEAQVLDVVHRLSIQLVRSYF